VNTGTRSGNKPRLNVFLIGSIDTKSISLSPRGMYLRQCVEHLIAPQVSTD
jgi:hypothetical protein